MWSGLYAAVGGENRHLVVTQDALREYVLRCYRYEQPPLLLISVNFDALAVKYFQGILRALQLVTGHYSTMLPASLMRLILPTLHLEGPEL